jgi:metallo-beta-lactamase class B
MKSPGGSVRLCGGRLRLTTPVALILSIACTTDGDVPPAATIEGHVAAAVAAAGRDHIALVDRICTQATGAEARPGAAAEDPDRPTQMPSVDGREEWYTPPVRVFDDLVFVGQTRYSAWAVLTSDGIIVIDPLYDYSVEAEVVDGLASLGLDAATIRYVVVSHAHQDHAGGARYLQDRFGARVVLAPEDWDLLESSEADWPKPERDIEAEDGYELHLGETTLRLLHTPGHTPGTISTLIPVHDGDEEHLALLVGGTAFNFMGDPDEARWFQEYVDASERLRDVVEELGVDVLLSNHPQYDGSTTKIPALAERVPGAPHPFVVGTEAVARYLTVAAECGRAGLLALD